MLFCRLTWRHLQTGRIHLRKWWWIWCLIQMLLEGKIVEQTYIVALLGAILSGINMVYLVIVLYISGLRSSSSYTWYRNFVCKQNMLCGNNLLQKYNLRAMYVYIVTVTLFYIWNTGSRLCILERLASLFLIVSSQQYVHLSWTRTMVVKCVNQKALSD